MLFPKFTVGTVRLRLDTPGGAYAAGEGDSRRAERPGILQAQTLRGAVVDLAAERVGPCDLENVIAGDVERGTSPGELIVAAQDQGAVGDIERPCVSCAETDEPARTQSDTRSIPKGASAQKDVVRAGSQPIVVLHGDDTGINLDISGERLGGAGEIERSCALLEDRHVAGARASGDTVDERRRIASSDGECALHAAQRDAQVVECRRAAEGHGAGIRYGIHIDVARERYRTVCNTIGS